MSDQPVDLSGTLRALLRVAADALTAADSSSPADDSLSGPYGPERVLEIVYTNWRGETAVRRIIPVGLRFAATQWHPAEQYLIDALDADRLDQGASEQDAARSFALADIHHIIPPAR